MIIGWMAGLISILIIQTTNTIGSAMTANITSKPLFMYLSYMNLYFPYSISISIKSSAFSHISTATSAVSA